MILDAALLNTQQYKLATVVEGELIDLVGRVFVNGPGDMGSIPGHQRLLK